MHTDVQYGRNLIAHFRPDSAAQIVSSGVKRARLAVTRLRRDSADHGYAEPDVREPAFSVILQLRDQARRELFFGERFVHRGAYPARTLSICNRLERPRANLMSPFDMLFFTIPQVALDEIADEHGAPRIGALSCPRCTYDETMWNLGQAILPALERPRELGQLYADHMMLATTIYLARTYGHLNSPALGARGALAPWQLRRATDLLLANLAADMSLDTLAGQIGLSRSHFARAFKLSTGDPPHRWLLRQRVEHAKHLMRETRLDLARIAGACGFADQSHLCRVFGRYAGMSPAKWRRL